VGKRMDGEVPGNALASAQAFTRGLLRQAETISLFEHSVERLEDDDTWVRSLSIRLPDGVRTSYLIVARADTPEGAVVAFHDAPQLLEALGGFCERLRNGSLRWKPDEYRRTVG
jgi:hypothetical protein